MNCGTTSRIAEQINHNAIRKLLILLRILVGRIGLEPMTKGL